MYGKLVMDYTLPLIISMITIYGLIYFSKKFNIGLDGFDNDKPQRLHDENIPRIGGLGILAGSSVLIFTDLGLLFLISSLPAFLAGFFEDIFDSLTPVKRLSIMIISAVLAVFLLNAVVYDIGYLKFPMIVAFLFTVVSIIGLINSINIIDGLNGLASGFSIIALISFSIVLYEYHDYELLTITLTLLAATIGFFLFNFPYGKIFLGDGGSYFLGFSLAVLSILIVARHPHISPWYPFLVMIYPIWEVIFSIYRRKFLRDVDPMSPDKLHLHSLLYKRFTKKNHMATVFILALISIFSFSAVLFKENTIILTVFSIAFISLYVLIYLSLVKFKTNRILSSILFTNFQFMAILNYKRK